MTDVSFWQEIMLEASKLDYGEPLPDLDATFLSVWSRHYHQITSLAPLRIPALEIGAGYGVLAGGLATLSNGEIWTTEHPSRNYVFRKDYRAFLEKKGVGIVLHDLCDGLPFKSQCFEQIYCCDVIEHMAPQDSVRVVAEIYRALAQGGQLILSTPNLYRLGNVLRFLLGHSVNPPINVQQIGETWGHIREFTLKELRSLLKKSGFEILSHRFERNPYFTADAFGTENVFKERSVKWINRVNEMLRHIVPPLGDGIIILAKKTTGRP